METELLIVHRSKTSNETSRILFTITKVFH